MGLFTFAATGVFFCSLIAGGIVLALRPRSARNRAFFALAFIVSLWNLATVFIYSADSQSTAHLWLRVGMALCALTPPTLLFYISIISGSRSPWLPTGLAYLAGVPFVYRAGSAGLIFEIARSDQGLWLFRVASPPGWIVAWAVYVLLLVGYAEFLLIRAGRNKAADVDVYSHRALAIAVGLWLTLAAVFDFAIGPRLGAPAIAPLLFLLLVVQTTISIVRHHFLAVTPGLLSRCLINNLQEGIVLVDTEANILLANNHSASILGPPTVAQGHKRFSWLIEEDGELSSGFAAVAAGRRKRFVTITGVPGDPDALVYFDLSQVRDGTCGTLGVLIQCRRAPDLSRLLRKHHITRREWQVVTHVVAGESYRIVAKDLGITVRTVKAHIASVYDKLHVKNRVELLNRISDTRIATLYPTP